MITVIPESDRYHADHGWLETRWHFSFADYHDPKNMNWSALRVFNDDVIAPGGNFDFHPHKDMEIVSYLVAGELEHRDLLGNQHVNRSGEVQVMSAGRGIVHSERNPSKTNPMRLVQIWIMPRHKGIEPRWAQKSFTREQRLNQWFQVVAPSEKVTGEALGIDQDAPIYVSALEKGKAVRHESAAGRHAYLFVIDGEVELNGQTLKSGDQARIKDETALSVKATEDSELILLDLP